MAEKNNKKFGKENYNKFNNRNKKNNKEQFYKKKNNYNNINKNNIKNNNNKKTIEEYEKIYLNKRMEEDAEKPICPICNKPIYITEEGITHNGTGELAHFECILEEIKRNNMNDIEENDKVVYLGSGTFGIIRERQSGKNFKLFVRKRINYENRKIKKVEDDADPEEEELFNV